MVPESALSPEKQVKNIEVTGVLPHGTPMECHIVGYGQNAPRLKIGAIPQIDVKNEVFRLRSTAFLDKSGALMALLPVEWIAPRKRNVSFATVEVNRRILAIYKGQTVEKGETLGFQLMLDDGGEYVDVDE